VAAVMCALCACVVGHEAPHATRHPLLTVAGRGRTVPPLPRLLRRQPPQPDSAAGLLNEPWQQGGSRPAAAARAPRQWPLLRAALPL
jgi:hypothetical protein